MSAVNGRNGKKKKGVKIVAITLAVLLVAGGGLYAFLSTREGKPVEVVPVSQWELGWRPDQMTLYGGIESAGAQSIYADKDVTVTEVLVAEGDEVHVGDPLLRYDATLDAIDLELKQLQLQQLEFDLVGYYKEYKKYARKDYESTLPSPSPSAELATGASASGARLGSGVLTSIRRLGERVLTGAGGRNYSNDPNNPRLLPEDESISAARIVEFLNLAIAGDYYARITGSDRVSDYRIDIVFKAVSGINYVADTILLDRKAVETGSGAQNDPYVYNLAASASGTAGAPPDILSVMGVNNSFLNARLADAALDDPIYLVLKDKISTESGFTASGFEIQMCITRIASTPSPATPTPPTTPDPSASPSESPTLDPGMVIPGGGGSGLTKAEKEAMARAAAKQIRDAELEYKQLRLDLQNLYLRGTDGVIRATIDGHVSISNDPAVTANGELLVQVKGSTGFFVRCVVGEMDLDKVPVGAELNGFSYDTGTECVGRVIEVGTVPVSDGYYSYGQRNLSGYEIRIFIEDGTSLMPGYYVEFTLQSNGGEQTESDALYLYQAYVRELVGSKYICVARDGVLRQVAVETGKVMYGYIEIKGGVLTREDYIAFPYSKDAKDGAPVKMPEDDVIY